MKEDSRYHAILLLPMQYIISEVIMCDGYVEYIASVILFFVVAVFQDAFAKSFQLR